MVFRSLADRWRDGQPEHQRVIRRARQVAALTVPHLMPPQGASSGETLVDPFQSTGARGVNNLAAKLLLSLLPPQSSFFTYEVDPRALAELPGIEGQTDEEVATQALLELSEREEAINRWIKTISFRPLAFELFRQLIVAGTTMVRFFRDRIPPRTYRLDEFQIDRDNVGRWKLIIVHETVDLEDLPRDALEAMPPNQRPLMDGGDRKVGLWTAVERRPEVAEEGPPFRSWQEIGDNGAVVPGSLIEWSREDEVPWLPMRLGAPSGENYGRSIGEEAFGDLRSLEGLSQAIVEAAAIVSTVKFGVAPESGMTPRELARAKNGAYLSGRAEGVNAIAAQIGNDLGTAASVRDAIRSDLQLLFLLNTAVRRDAERVTAAEIRLIAEELEEGLGGAFSALSEEFQRPLAEKVEKILVNRGDLDSLPDNLADVKVVTGLEAVGRGSDRQRLRAYASDAQAVLGSDAWIRFAKPTEWLRRLALADGIDPDGLVRTEEEVRAAQQAALQQRLQQETAGPVSREVARAAVNEATEEGQ